MKRATLSTCLLLLVLTALASSSLADSPGATDPPAQKPGDSDAAERGVGARTEDSVWMVSTRNLGCCCVDTQAEPDFRWRRYECGSGWQDADWSAWSAAEQPGTVTVVYVHGNRMEGGEVFGRGLAAYRALVRNTADGRPIRFVVWSWPSDKLKGPHPKRDALVKAARTSCESFYLACFLARLNPDTPLSLWGYSFGARIVSGALHLAGGGSLGSWQLSEPCPRPAHSMRVALYAAGMNNDWWRPGHFHGEAWSAVDRLCLLYNRCDPVLRLYPHLDRRCRPQALGYTGFCWAASLGDEAWRLEQTNVGCEIGKTHDEFAYFGSCAVMRRVRETLLAP